MLSQKPYATLEISFWDHLAFSNSQIDNLMYVSMLKHKVEKVMLAGWRCVLVLLGVSLQGSRAGEAVYCG